MQAEALYGLFSVTCVFQYAADNDVRIYRIRCILSYHFCPFLKDVIWIYCILTELFLFKKRSVIAAECRRNIHSLRAWHTISAPRTADLFHLPQTDEPYGRRGIC